MATKILDYIDGQWTDEKSADLLDVTNPASASVIGQVVMTPKNGVAQAVDAAEAA